MAVGIVVFRHFSLFRSLDDRKNFFIQDDRFVILTFLVVLVGTVIQLLPVGTFFQLGKRSTGSKENQDEYKEDRIVTHD